MKLRFGGWLFWFGWFIMIALVVWWLCCLSMVLLAVIVGGFDLFDFVSDCGLVWVAYLDLSVWLGGLWFDAYWLHNSVVWFGFYLYFVV